MIRRVMFIKIQLEAYEQTMFASFTYSYNTYDCSLFTIVL